MVEDLPPSVNDLVAFLGHHGFKNIYERYDEAEFGNWISRYDNGHLWVNVTRDRSQWLVSLAPAGVQLGYDPDVWEACIAGVTVPDQTSELTEQVAFIKANLDKINAYAEAPSALAQLKEQADSRAMRWMGLQ